MTALLPQIIEPAGNVVRLGAEAASQIQRKATAKVRYTDASVGYEDTIDPNAPAIPWDSGTGFGPSDGPPTTPGTVDLVNGYTRFVTFIEAGHNATQPMYVAAVADWAALAGAAGGRTLIPLDLWELHGWRYCGPEFTGEQALPNSGRYTASGGVAVAASTDVTTHGDYGTQHIAFPIAYAAGLVPAVVPASEDAAFVATVSNINNTGFDVTVRRVRPLTQPISGELDMTIPSGSNAIDTQIFYGPTFDAKPMVNVFVVDDPAGLDHESEYQPSMHDRAVDSFFAVIFHMPHPAGFVTTAMYDTGNTTPASTTPIVTGGVNGSPSTGNNSDGTETGDISSGTAGAAHRHDHNPIDGHHTHPEAAHDHNTGDHVHRADIFPKETADRTVRVGWTAQGQQHADATHVPVSWVARG